MKKSSASAASTSSITGFLEALGSSAPTPGGGAASALVGATAAALTEMVAQLTVGQPQVQAVEDGVRSPPWPPPAPPTHPPVLLRGGALATVRQRMGL